MPHARTSVRLEDLLRLKAEARGFSLLPRQPVQSVLAGRRASRLRGRGLDFEELRDYRPGDDVRSIDWRATARLGRAHVKVFTQERERPVVLVVDQRTPMYFGSRRAMKSVTAAEVAALGAWRALEAGDRVGGIVFNESKIVSLRPRRSRNQVLRLLHEIVSFNRQLEGPRMPEGTVSLNDALESALQCATHDHLVVLVTDLDGADARTEQLATRLAAHNDVLVVAVYDPLGANLAPLPGMTAAVKGGVFRIPASPAFAESFEREFQRVLDRWREVFRALKVPILPIETSAPPADQIRALFGGTPRAAS